jgi:hypothetical protein
MSKRDLSRHQEKIVKRYYQNRDTIALSKLGDLMTEIYLADDPAKAQRLWDRAAKALVNAGAEQARIDRVMQTKDVKLLGKLVTELQG